MMKKIILASKSPRRKELLQTLNLPFEIVPSNYTENIHGKPFSYGLIENLSFQKANWLFQIHKKNKQFENTLIIGADTVVVLDQEILLKPKNFDEAFNILKKLSNKTHKVITSITVLDTETANHKTISVTSEVTFQKLNDEQITTYIKQNKPFDKAGAYGIQELDETFIKMLKGSKNNVIGLSTSAIKNILLQMDKNLKID